MPAAFERRRTPPPSLPGWFEAHLTLALGGGGAVLIWTSIHPSRGHAEQVCLVWPSGASPIVMIEDDIPIPAKRWEFRTSGLWVEQVCEKPLDHWSYGLEAFALELDNPTELLQTGYGTRVPMGWELDFVGNEEARWLLTSGEPLERAGAYSQKGSMEGLLLGGGDDVPFEGLAQRWHWWGTTPLSGAGIRTTITDEQLMELHLPLSQGPVVVRRSSTVLLVESAATIS